MSLCPLIEGKQTCGLATKSRLSSTLFCSGHPSEIPEFCVHTWRPASLLWRFMAERASGRFSLASANSRDTIPPNSMSSLQPPHFQPSPGEPWRRLLHPQMAAEPSAHERVTAKATPAEAMAWTKADSRVAAKEGDGR